MTDLPHFAQAPMKPDQLSVIAQLFAHIAVGAEDDAELLIAGMSPEQREQFSVTLRDAWESQVWLYGRASELVGNVILTSPYKEG